MKHTNTADTIVSNTGSVPDAGVLPRAKHTTHRTASTVGMAVLASLLLVVRTRSAEMGSADIWWMGDSMPPPMEDFSLQAAGSTDIPIVAEIDWVQIVESHVGEPWLRNPNDYYVEFSHDYPKMIDPLAKYTFPFLIAPSYYYTRFSDDYPSPPYVQGKSMVLSKHEASSWVNLPLDKNTTSFQVPLECKIKKNRWFPLPDKTYLNAHVDLNDIDLDGTGLPEVTAGIFLRGREIGSQIKLRFLRNTYYPVTRGDKTQKLKRADLFYHLFLKVFQQGAVTFSTTVCQLEKPIQRANPNLETSFELDGTVEYPDEDEIFGGLSSLDRLVANILLWLPKTTRNNPVSDRGELRHYIRTKQLLTNVVQPLEGHWKAPLSDESMARYFFSGLGMFLIKRDKDGNNGYIADMMILSKHQNVTYEKKFEAHGDLGCKVWFDNDAKIAKIEHSDGTVTPSHRDWEWAKLKVRSAAFVVMGLEHLLHYHLRWGNVPAMALRKFLRPTNPLRQALTPHFFRTHYTCASARFSLVRETSALGRALPFDYEKGYVPVLKNLLARYKFELYPEELKRRGMLDCKEHIGASDGIDQRKVIMDYVSNLFDEIHAKQNLIEDEEVKDMYKYLASNLNEVPSEFSIDNLKLVWGEIIFRVTGMHQAVGNVATYALEPFMVNFRMEDKKMTGNWESITAVSAISGRTQPNNYPVISDDWSRVLRDRKSKAYSDFRSDLKKLEETIDERNRNRRFKNVDFHPDITAISVSS